MIETTPAGSARPTGSRVDELSPGGAGDGYLRFGSVLERWPLVCATTILAAAIAFGIATIMRPVFTARTTLLPPQQQGSANAALASLGALAGLAGGSAAFRTPADQYIALMRSVTVTDRIIDKFDLVAVYGEVNKHETRKELTKNVQIVVGKKDGLISVEVDDHDPRRAAEIANAHVENLRYLTNNLAVSEAKQRRVFFEGQLQQTKQNLIAAQTALQQSGITQGALKAEPKVTAEAYAKLRAEVASAEIRLQTMNRILTGNAPELDQLRTTVGGLRAELARMERSAGERGDSNYVSQFREFKYQETMFEMFARQYELARVDESREGALIQVVDVAMPPETKSKPLRGLITLAAALLGMFIGVVAALLLEHRRGGIAQSARIR
jgi:uncharacterized protein involved in exopolysaccharide biosynthesis